MQPVPKVGAPVTQHRELIAHIPAPVDPGKLDFLERAIVGGLILASPEQRAAALAQLDPTDFTSAPLRAIVATLAYAEQNNLDADPTALTLLAGEAGYVTPIPSPWLGELVTNLTGLEYCPLAESELLRVPALVMASARRKARETAQRLTQASQDFGNEDFIPILATASHSLACTVERLGGTLT